MENSEKIYIDSNYFIALYNLEDANYAHAFQVSRHLDGKPLRLFTSNLVFAEVVTVLSQRVGKKTAIQTGNYLLSRADLSLLHIDEELQEESWRIFQRIEQKNISFIDCSIIAAMKTENITNLLTLDKKDFKQLQKHYRFSFYE